MWSPGHRQASYRASGVTLGKGFRGFTGFIGFKGFKVQGVQMVHGSEFRSSGLNSGL